MSAASGGYDPETQAHFDAAVAAFERRKRIVTGESPDERPSVTDDEEEVKTSVAAYTYDEKTQVSEVTAQIAVDYEKGRQDVLDALLDVLLHDKYDPVKATKYVLRVKNWQVRRW